MELASNMNMLVAAVVLYVARFPRRSPDDYKAIRIKNDIIMQNRPIASERAKPRIAYEKSWAFSEGLRAYPMTREPNTVPIPAPDPAAPTMAQPAPMYRAAESISFCATEVCRHLTAMLLTGLHCCRAEVMGLPCLAADETMDLAGAMSRAAYMFSVWVLKTKESFTLESRKSNYPPC